MERVECINKVELQGRIGYVSTMGVRKAYARFSVATNYCYHDKDGNTVIETTWHYCECFEGENISSETIAKIDKGVSVNLKGRLRNVRYIDANGVERTSTDVYVNELTILDGVAIN